MSTQPVQPYNDIPPGVSGADTKPIEFDPMRQIGRTGLKQFSGFVVDEFLQILRGQRGAQAYREVVDNSPLVGGILRMFDLALRGVDRFVEPYSEDAADVKIAERVEQMLDDMDYTWQDHMSEASTMLAYGFAPCEMTMKKCMGWTNDPATRSRFDDGVIAPRNVALRAQDSLFRWEFDEEGGTRAMIQLPAPDYIMRTIPFEKLLNFRPQVEKGNPEGRSLLRSGYFNWVQIKRLTESESIKAERDANGLPVFYVDGRNMTSSASADQKAVVAMYEKIGKNLRVDEQGCVIMPMVYDPVTKMPLFKFELMHGNAGASFDYDKTITRHEVRLAISLLADAMMLGHDKVGSFALAKNKTESTMGAAINAWLDSIMGVWNRHALPLIYSLNGWPMDRMCELKHGDVSATNIEQLANAFKSLAAAGMPLFPDENLENHIREEMNLPERSEQITVSGQEVIDDQQMNPGTPQAIQPPQQGGGFGKAIRKAKHQPRSRRGNYAPSTGNIANALDLLRDRQTLGGGDSVAHGFKVADPTPFDSVAMSHTLNLDNAPVERVALKDMIATQPNVRREHVRNFIQNPNTVLPGQRTLSGQLEDRPVVVRHEDKNYIADGHHRLAAKKLLGYQDALVRVVSHDPKPEGELTK